MLNISIGNKIKYSYFKECQFGNLGSKYNVHFTKMLNIKYDYGKVLDIKNNDLNSEEILVTIEEDSGNKIIINLNQIIKIYE
jgi:hypothetical protein